MKDSKKLDTLFEKAVGLHQASQLQEATEIYDEILKIDPNHFDALQLSATIHAHTGQLSVSLDLFAKAIKVNDKNPKILNNYGYVLAQAGHLDVAQNVYERAVKLDPNYLDALNNLANLHQQKGDFDKSIVLYDKITQLNSTYLQAYFNKGVALQRSARLEEALRSYDNALHLKPDYFDAYLNKATVLKDMKRYEESLNMYRQILTVINGPASFEVHNNCGNLLEVMGQLDQALLHFDQAVLANPYQALTYSNRGNVLQRLGRNQEAILSYEVALTIDPLVADFYSNRGNALQSILSLDLALFDYTRAIELSPGHAQAYYNRGNLFKIKREFELAIASYTNALCLFPNYSDAHNNLGNVYKELNLLEAAERSYDQAIKSNPLQVDAINNKGVTLQRLLKLEEAIACFDLAIERSPENIKSHINKAIILFLQGKFTEAWRLYQLRLMDNELISRPFKTNKPMMHLPICENNASTRLLVWSEQGVGDEVMFASMFQRLASLVSQLVVMVDLRLIPLFQRSFPKIRFVNKDCDVDPAIYDFHLPMGSIGLALQMDESKIKSLGSPYLRADINENVRLKAQLETFTRLGPVVNKKPIFCGISWHTNNPNNGIDRNVDVNSFLESLAIPGVYLVNLQYSSPLLDGPQNEYLIGLEKLKAEGLLVADVDNYNELDRLASLIKACDIVISIDNSTVHLSAALGVPTWILLPVMPDWRWMLERVDSPWYESVRLFRQEKWGDWINPLKEIKAKLSEFVLARTM